MIEATKRRHGGREPKDRHHAAVVAAELLRIERQLRAVGPMPRRAVPAC